MATGCQDQANDSGLNHTGLILGEGQVFWEESSLRKVKVRITIIT